MYDDLHTDENMQESSNQDRDANFEDEWPDREHVDDVLPTDPDEEPVFDEGWTSGPNS